MGVEVRAKDKVFLAVVVPLAAVAAYAFLWRADAARRLDSLVGRNAALVAPGDFPMEMRRAERRLADSAAELESERAVPAPAAKMSADAGATPAERESSVLNAFREAGLVVVRSETPEPQPEGGAGDAVSEAVGPGGWRATCRRYTLDGTYPAVKRALDAFAARKMAVVVDKAEMRESGRGRWTLEAWL